MESLDALVGDGSEVNGNWSLQIQLSQPGVVLERWILNFNRKNNTTSCCQVLPSCCEMIPALISSFF